MKWFITLALSFVALGASAQTVNQGQGNPNVTDWSTSNSARRGGATTEVCVTNAAGGTAVPTTALAQRKAIELQNLGPNSIFCTVDGQAPLATGALGREITADGVWSLDAGQAIAIKCIAATAAQVTTNCTMVTELR